MADTQPTKKSADKGPRYISPTQQIQYMRFVDQRGLNVFESPKEAAPRMLSVTPRRESLEDLFVREVEGSDTAFGAAPRRKEERP